MATVAESTGDASALNASLESGIAVLSQNQTVKFTQYVRKVLPLDGYVFWLQTAQTICATGSLHVATALEQREEETIGINRVIFTAEQKIQDFDAVDPGVMYVATVGKIQFAFSMQKNFYQQAGLYHYGGDAVYPALAIQLITDPAQLDPDDAIVSNSLPLWLALGSTAVFGKTTPTFPIYPSFLVPQDVAPPYASVHIGENDTDAIQGAPGFDLDNTHTQLCRDHVKITLYGLRNDAALDFQDYLFQYSLDTDNIGIMNMPVIRDEKRTQRELGVIAQKKSFVVDVNYYQSRINDVARQFLLSSVQAYLPNDL